MSCHITSSQTLFELGCLGGSAPLLPQKIRESRGLGEGHIFA